MNSYKKYCPNVFLAKCEGQYKKGEEIILTTKYGKENPSIVHNLIFERDGFYYYSITRVDGFDSRQRAKNKAERLEGFASNAQTRSTKYWEASKEGHDFLSLGEPIKVGHHSERRHRALIERNHARMDKCVKESDKASEYEQRAKYWANRTEDINLSMVDSLEYFKFEYEKALKHHTDMKDGKIERSHSYSLTYAKKSVNEMKKKMELAVRLWG